jgi:hypothetical protein
VAADRRVLVLGAIGAGLITWRELQSPTSPTGVEGDDPPLDLPNPAAYAGAIIVYGLAAVLAEVNGPLAVALAAGWTLTILYTNLQETGNVAGIERKG